MVCNQNKTFIRLFKIHASLMCADIFNDIGKLRRVVISRLLVFEKIAAEFAPFEANSFKSELFGCLM